MVINHYFVNHPTKISVVNLGIPLSYKEELIKTAYSFGDVQNNSTNVQAIMSNWRIWTVTDVFNKFLDRTYEILSQLNLNTDTRYRLKILECWTAIYKTNHYTKPHDHKPSPYSFVYYLQSPNPPTPLIFDKCNYEILPQEDNLIVFPAYLSHRVPKHQHDQDRISIAGNVVLESLE